MENLRVLLGNAPSVKRFNALLAGLSPEERKRHYYHVYYLSMQHWGEYPKKYRKFFADLVCHDWQCFLNYLCQDTVLGVLRCLLDDDDLLIIVFHLLAKNQKKHRVSFNHLAFCALLSFDLGLKISTLSDQIRCKAFYPEEMLELLEEVIVLP
jgi:hypothetical protein